MATHAGTSLVQSGSSYLAGRNINNVNIVYQDNASPFAASDKQTILDWLSEIASVNNYAIHSETYAKLAPDTASWILREPKFDAWLSEENGILWGVGIRALFSFYVLYAQAEDHVAGAGKTVLTSFVIQHLQERANTPNTKEVVIFLYCRFDDSLTISNILAILLEQISKSSESTPVVSHIRQNLYIPCKAKKIRPTENELAALTVEVFRLIPTKVSIAVDALDELQDEVCEKLVEILVSLKRSLFLTSRELSISRLGTPNIQIQAPDVDFANFVTHEVMQLPKIWSLLENRKEVLDELIKEITSKSAGMFLLAALQLSTIKGVTNVKSLRKAISALPTKLTDMYELNLKRIKDQSEEESTLAHRAILWVTYACRPLKVSELLEALIVEPESDELDPDSRTNERTLISVCCGLLEFEDETGTVRLIHYTAYDFFSSFKAGLFQNPHTIAATICAVYLRLSRIRFQEVSTYYDLERLNRSRPFATYSCKYIGHHCFRSTSENYGELPRVVHDALSKNRLLPLSHASMDELRSPSLHCGTMVHFSALHGIVPIRQASRQSLNENSQNGWAPLLYASIVGQASVVMSLLNTHGVDINVRNKYMKSALHLATEEGHESVVRLLLDSPGIDVNARGLPDLNTPLHQAVLYDHESIVHLLLGSPKIEINARNVLGNAAIDAALEHGRVSIARLLLKFPGIDINVQGKQHTPLQHASQMGYEELVQLLLGLPGIDVNAKNSSGITALHFASVNGHTSVVQMLLGSPGIDVNVQDVSGFTPLLHASYKGYCDIVQMLLGSPGINVNAQDVSGFTPLLHASHKGYCDIVQMLLGSPGVDINRRDRYQCTALHYAFSKSHNKIVESLLGFDEIELNARDVPKYVDLHHAALNGYVPVMRLLLDSTDLNINRQDADGDTALHCASLEGHETVVQMLLGSPGIDITRQNIHGHTALHCASFGGHKELVKLLFDHSATDIDAKDHDDHTPLHCACMKGDVAVVQLLLDQPRIDVTVRDAYGYTPLHFAALTGCEPIVRLLLNVAETEVDAQSLDGITPLHLASTEGHESIVEMLLGYRGTDTCAAQEIEAIN